MSFSARMVRAILDERKTQTRHVMKPQPVFKKPFWSWAGAYWGENQNPIVWPYHSLSNRCPYGAIGDRIWVHETCRFTGDPEGTNIVQYKAGYVPGSSLESILPKRWTPASKMPRWASRILLEIVNVRVERLQDISENDALAQGFIKLPATGRVVQCQGDQYFGQYWRSAKQAFLDCGWSNCLKDNPWVWVIEFKQVGDQ
ncbi:hypothetical protein GCM10027347_59730 [Larkinella harenae]